MFTTFWNEEEEMIALGKRLGDKFAQKLGYPTYNCWGNKYTTWSGFIRVPDEENKDSPLAQL